MNVEEVMAELAAQGSDTAKKTFLRHGAREPFYGVRIEHLKKMQKRIKKNHELALALYGTGNSDAMYLAGLIADPARMKKSDLQKWVKQAYWYVLSDYTVAWVTSESPLALEMARAWIDSPKELIASAGWATFASYVAITPDEDLDLDEIEQLLVRVEEKIHSAPNRTRYSMNGFVIAVGAYVSPLSERAKAAGLTIGRVEVDVGDTACKVPDAVTSIEKALQRGKGGKRKTAFC